MDFINKNTPLKCIINYAIFVCGHLPLKIEQYSVRLVVGGNSLVYEEDPGYPAASMLETKILLNSIIYDSQQGSRLMSCDLKYFFLATPMLQH